ncbi:MAG TPA: transcriptional regulator [bacterium]|nr:transcriptional regulator [bacterium]
MQDFFATHPVFRVEEFDAFKAQSLSTNKGTRDAHLAHFVKKSGRLVGLRRGLYAVVPPGRAQETLQVDPYHLCSKLAPDAVLAYHTALQFHGVAHSLWSTYNFLASKIHVNYHHGDARYRSVLPPKTLANPELEVLEREHNEMPVKVTSLERTLVDCLDRPQWGGEYEEVWNSFQTVEYLNIDRVVAYALALGNGLTAAKTGFFLEQNKERWHITDVALEPLVEARNHKATLYWARSSIGKSTQVPRWHLLVPNAILERTWEEPNENDPR